MIKHDILSVSGQELPAELGKYIWLSKADTSQEAPFSKSGSSSPTPNFLINQVSSKIYFSNKKEPKGPF